MRVLVLSSRLTDRRRDALRALAQEPADLLFASPADGWPDASEFDAFLIDGRQPPQPLGTLRAHGAEGSERLRRLPAVEAAPSERNGFWADLLGVVAGPEPPVGEYFARLTEAHSHITARVAREFSVLDRFAALAPLGDGKVIMDVSVA